MTAGNGSPSELQFTRNKNSETDIDTLRDVENAMLIEQNHVPSLSSRIQIQSKI